MSAISTRQHITLRQGRAKRIAQIAGSPSLDGLSILSLSLSMNRPTPALLSGGERAFTRVFRYPSWEGLGVGSWSQCMRKSEWRLSMNRVVRIAPASDSAEVFLLLLLLLIEERRARVRQIESGSWSQCTARMPSGLSMNRPLPGGE